MSEKTDAANGKVWDGRFSNIIISDSTYPELYAQLSGIPSRLRAERLRVLATIGLSIVHGRFSPMNANYMSEALSSNGTVEVEGVNESKTKLKDAKADLKSKLRFSVQTPK